jgi:hypothetical protein
MIDGIKILTPPPPGIETRLKFSSVVNDSTGEITMKTAQSNGLYFSIRKENLLVTGSLHKFFNAGIHNHNDFRFTDLQETLTKLNQLYAIPFEAKIQNIEYGFNVITPFPVSRFLNSVFLYNGKPFNIIRERHFNYYQNARQRFILKLYDKGLQYHLDQNILRIETKVFKMAHLEKTGISCLSDLLEIDKIKELGNNLLRDFNQIICCESPTKVTNNKHREFILQGLSFNYWHELKETDYRLYENKLSKFKGLVIKYGLNHFQKEVAKLLSKKLGILTEVQKIEFRDFNTLYIPLISLNQRLCPITGLSIAMQRAGSTFLCIAGIRFYYENDKSKFDELKKRLSTKWINAPLKTQFREIAHSIRNEFYNPRHNNARDIKHLLDRNPSLFNQKELVNPERLAVSTL